MKDLYKSFFNNASEMFVAVDAKNGTVLRCNETILTKTGYSREEVIGRPVFNLYHPDSLAAAKEAFAFFKKTGSVKNVELTMKSRNGEALNVSLSASAVTNKTGRVLYSCSVLRDITEAKQMETALKRSNQALSVHNRCIQAVMRAKNEPQLLKDICSILVETGGYRLAWFGYALKDEKKTVQPIVHAGYEDRYLESIHITWADTERGQGPTGKAIRSGKPETARFIRTDPRFSPWREQALRNGYRSSIAIPVRFGSGALGVLNVYAREPDGFDSVETDLLFDLGRSLAFGIDGLNIKTKQQAAEVRLRESRERTRRILKAAKVGLFDCDLTSNKVYFSPEWKRQIGYRDDEISDSFEEWERRVHPDDLEGCLAKLRQYVKKARTNRSLTFRFRHKDGRYLWILAKVFVLRKEDGVPVKMMGSHLDITKIKTAQEKIQSQTRQLHRLAAHLQDTIEHERLSIAREIHDDLGQALSALKMDLGWIKKRLRDDRKIVSEKLDSMAEVIRQCADSVRRICSELRPGILDDLGLEYAMEWHRDRFQDHSGIPCGLKSDIDGIEIPAPVAIAVYRIFQEALTNISRHSEATRARAMLTVENGGLLFEIGDDGKGVHAGDLKRQGSFGLIGMRERVNALGGDFDIQGDPGKGTCIRIFIPLDEFP